MQQPCMDVNRSTFEVVLRPIYECYLLAIREYMTNLYSLYWIGIHTFVVV